MPQHSRCIYSDLQQRGACPFKIHETVLSLLSVPIFEQSIEIYATWEIGEFFGNVLA
jgi:hypothetical protein